MKAKKEIWVIIREDFMPWIENLIIDCKIMKGTKKRVIEWWTEEIREILSRKMRSFKNWIKIGLWRTEERGERLRYRKKKSILSQILIYSMVKHY